jgi:ABC-type multidrug transport system ATPase subunit
MDILLKNISKRFGLSWVFRDISCAFKSGHAYAITGANGSGKSTLLKIVSGGLAPSGGQIQFQNSGGKVIYWSDAAPMMSFAAPYVDLVERLTLQEQVRFHYNFRKPLYGMDETTFLQAIDLEKQRHKQIRDFSSGMKQRLKLAFNFYTDSSVALFDEPTTNLDRHWSDWYNTEVSRLAKDRLVIVASNDEKEYKFCNEVVRLEGLGIEVNGVKA